MVYQQRPAPLSVYMNEMLQKCSSDCKVTLVADHANQHEHAAELTKVSTKFGVQNLMWRRSRNERQSDRERNYKHKNLGSSNNKLAGSLRSHQSSRSKTVKRLDRRPIPKVTKNQGHTVSTWDPFETRTDGELESRRRQSSSISKGKQAGVGVVGRAA
jgi:hypothetical protein